MLDRETLARIVADSRDDRAVLRLLRREIPEIERLLAEARLARTACAQRLADLEVPMTVIARDAGVSDSYLSRKVTKPRGRDMPPGAVVT